MVDMAQPMPRAAQGSMPRIAQGSMPRIARWAILLGVVVVAGLTLGFLAGLARPRGRSL